MVATLLSCQAHLICEGQHARLKLEVPLQPQGSGLELTVEGTSTKDGALQQGSPVQGQHQCDVDCIFT